MLNVWTYWAGPRPAWIDICLESIRRCCKRCTFHLLVPEDLDDCTICSRWRELPPGVGTDCLRAALLYRYGGLWLDADTICIKDPTILLQQHDPAQFLYSRWPAKPDRVIAGYVYSPQGHPIAKMWLDKVNSTLEQAENIGWGDLGEKALTPIVNCCGSPKLSWQIALETFLPIDIDTNVRRYFQHSGWRDFTTQDTIAFGLNYSWMQDHHSTLLSLMDIKHRPSTEMVLRLLEDTKELNDAKQTR